MNFKISKKEFLDALSLSSRAISSTTPLPSLSGIKFTATENSLTLVSSDSNISIRTKGKLKNLPLRSLGSFFSASNYLKSLWCVHTST